MELKDDNLVWDHFKAGLNYSFNDHMIKSKSIPTVKTGSKRKQVKDDEKQV